MKKVIVIGSGPAGYTAGIYLARANLDVTLISGYAQGGQLMTTTDVENFPGFADVIQGPWLMEQMQKQAENMGVKMVMDMISSVSFGARPFVLKGDSGEYEADAVIIATGAQASWLGLTSEEEFRGFGVSACATCDGFFFRGKEVIVVGGGNTAVEEALYMTNHASKVYLVHRRDKLRCEKVLEERLLKHPKIEVIWNAVIDEVLGVSVPNKAVTGVRLKSTADGSCVEKKIDGIFVAIGHKPATGFLGASGLKLDSEGYIEVNAGSSLTNITGVFAAGDVHDKVYRQAVTAAGSGCIAALDAIKYLESVV